MAQELTFNITEDTRRLKRPTTVKDFKLSFGHADQGPTDVVIGDDGNIVQGRYGDSARQVFVNVVQGENNEPVDITGYLPEFNGCIPDAEHIVIDNWDGVLVDPRHGRFRFDFPIQAFTVAGSYKQAYFRLVQNGTGKTLATLEFDMQVLEDFVYSNIVPQDYVTPYLDMINKLKDAYTNFVGKTQDSFDQAKKRLDDIMSTVEDKADTVEQRLKVDEQALTELSKKIDGNGLFTQAEADEFEKTLTKKVTDLMEQYTKKFDQGLATIADKANYNYDYQLDSDTNILFPAFTKQDQNSYRDELYISDNGVDLYHVNQYGSNVDFTDHPVAVDCSTMFYDGYVYQIYDYVKSPYPDQIESHFLGGNGIQIRRSKDLINWEFIDVDLPSKWLQTWAPEWYVEDGNVYVVVSLSDCSASAQNTTDGVVNWVKQTYIISTTDFKTWSDPQLINLGLDNCIDPFIIKENGHYYLFVKNEVTGKITEFKSDSLAAGYKQIGILDTNSQAVFEGPAVVEYKGGYLLIVDAPNEGLVAFYSTDIENWGQTAHLAVNDGQIVKHCTPIVLKNNELREIVKNYVKAKAGQSPFAVSNHGHHLKLSYIYPGQTKVSLFPETLYVAQYNVASEIDITDYDTNLLCVGDHVGFALMSGNYNAKIMLKQNSSRHVWLPSTLELAAAKGNSNSILQLRLTNLGLVPEVYQPSPSFVYSKNYIDLKETFAKSGGEFKPDGDGYLMVTVQTSGNQYLNILWVDAGQSLFANTFQGSGNPATTVPLKANQTYCIQYNVDKIASAKFYYAEVASK